MHRFTAIVALLAGSLALACAGEPTPTSVFAAHHDGVAARMDGVRAAAKHLDALPPLEADTLTAPTPQVVFPDTTSVEYAAAWNALAFPIEDVLGPGGQIWWNGFGANYDWHEVTMAVDSGVAGSMFAHHRTEDLVPFLERWETLEYAVFVRTTAARSPQATSATTFEGGWVVGEAHVYRLPAVEHLGGFRFAAGSPPSAAHWVDPEAKYVDAQGAVIGALAGTFHEALDAQVKQRLGSNAPYKTNY